MYPMPDHIDPAATLESLMTFSDGPTCLSHNGDTTGFSIHQAAEYDEVEESCPSAIYKAHAVIRRRLMLRPFSKKDQTPRRETLLQH